MNKPKVIISNYDDLHNPYYGGGGAWMIQEFAKVLKDEFDITVITAKYPGAKDETVEGVKYRRIGWALAGSQLGQLLFHLLLPLQVIKFDFDIWLESFTPPHSTSFLQWFTRRPVVGMAHSLMGSDMAKKYKLPFHWVEKVGLRTYRHLIVLTQHAADSIKLFHPNCDIHVVPNGVPDRMVSLPITTSRPKHILYLGRIAFREKGLKYLIDAYSRIASQTRIPLIVAGSGAVSEVKLVKRYIANLGLSHRIRLIGHVSGRRRDQVLRTCYFLAAPSRIESFGLTVAEAFCFARPAVVFDIDGFKWVPKTAALKASKFDVEEYSRLMLTLLSHRSVTNHMGRSGKRLVQNLALSRVPGRYREVILEVLNGNKGRV